MQTGPTPPPNKTDDVGQPACASTDPYAEIVALGGRGASKEHFWAESLAVLARDFVCPYAALHVRYPSEVVQHDVHSGPTDPNFWKPSLQQFLTESLADPKPRIRLLKARSGDTRIAFLGVPVFDAAGSTIGAVALVVPADGSFDVLPSLARLEGLVRLAFVCSEGVGPARARFDGSTATGPQPTSASSAKSMSRAASYSTAEEFAFAMTNELASRMGFQQVALGWVHGPRVRILSVSGLDQVNEKSPGIVRLRAAMEECLDSGDPIVHQAGDSWSSLRYASGHRLHQQWHAAANGDAVASIPLASGTDDTVAVLSLRRLADQPFTDEQIDELRGRVEGLVPGLILIQRASRGLCRHVVDHGRSLFGAMAAPGRWGRKAAVVAAVLTASWFLFGTMEYDLRVPCTVTPARTRHVTAPFDGMIASTLVVEADRVRKGQILCTLHRRDLELTRAELVAELTVVQRQMDQAIAENTPVEVRLAQARQTLAETRLASVNRRIEQTTIRAPIDGVVVSGDLRKMIGNVVIQGTALFQVAPYDEWTLELAVPESASGDLAVGLDGSFVSIARPEASSPFHIDHVSADSQIRGGQNVYIAEAALDGAAAWVRPGMEGTARIHVGRRAVWWIVLHRAIDYFRVSLWL